MNSFNIGLVECTLYLQNEPTDVRRLVKITGLSKSAVLQALASLKRTFEEEERGLQILEVGGGFCFSAKPRYYEVLKDTYGSRNVKRLSKAALETLSIVAYSQPITKAEIENIRGVSADGMIKLLVEMDFVKEVGKKDSPGKPTQYGTTKGFLMRFGLSSIANLPKLDEADSERFDKYDE